MSGYVHAVLVPELAVALIMQDMCVGRADALRVLEESAEIGEVLNEEEEEVVPRELCDEDGGGGVGEGGGGGKRERRCSVVD